MGPHVICQRKPPFSFSSFIFPFELSVSDHLNPAVNQQIKTYVFVLCVPASSICPPFCFNIKASLVGTDLSPFRQIVICNTCLKKWPYFHDHHDQTLWLCRSSNTRPSVILSLYVTPLHFHPSLPSSHSFTLCSCLLGPSRTTETCCTRCAG